MAKIITRRFTIVFRYLVLFFCICGICYLCFNFFETYRTYPTVADIQDISPSYLEMPAFTFCNPIGYNYSELCDFEKDGKNVGACLPRNIHRYIEGSLCQKFKSVCINGPELPSDFQMISYEKLGKSVSISPEDHDKLRIPLEDYLNCTIEIARRTESCDLSNVMGSFFTNTEIIQYCYSIYSMWGEPSKKRTVIPKESVMKLRFKLNTTNRPEPDDASEELEEYIPRHNLPDFPSIQMSVHSPYFLTSPYTNGYSFSGGKAYNIRVTMEEKLLLSEPYQTKCTDYMKTWLERGGKAPIDRMGVIQECRLNKAYKEFGCVPSDVDYPHSYRICKDCKNCRANFSTDDCINLGEHFNEPCHSVSYVVTREDKTISVRQSFSTAFLRLKEDIVTRIKEWDCTDSKIWRPECGKIDIDVMFDRFKISKVTHIPKIELSDFLVRSFLNIVSIAVLMYCIHL